MGRAERHPGGRGGAVRHPERPGPNLTEISPGAVPSPNIWRHPHVYEIENGAVDRAGTLSGLMRSLAAWAGRDILDVGCGTGYHLPGFASTARTVVGVEPHGDLVAIARRRVRRLPNVRVLQGLADALPLAGHSVDLVHARWAYFFGPGCEAGLSELDRVVRPGGRAFVIDNDPSRSKFGAWFRRGYPDVDWRGTEAFWVGRGWDRHQVDIDWTFDSREDFEAVVRIEFTPLVAEEILAGHEGTSVDYAVNVWTRSW